MWQDLQRVAGEYIPKFAGAIAILVIGWLVALLLAAVTRRGLRRTTADERLAKWLFGEEAAQRVEADKWLSKIVYYVVMLFVLIAFLQSVGLTIVTGPLNELLTQVFRYAPRLLGVVVLVAVAWVLATLLKLVVTRAIEAAKIDDKLAGEAGMEDEQKVPVSRTVGNAVYWLVFLIFLPAILGALALEGLLRPVQGMMDKVLGFLPNIFAAVVIILIGWFVARILQRIVASALAAVGLDRLSENVGIAKAMGKQKLSDLVGLIVYILVLIPVLIAGLNALALEAITRPASNMLNAILAALPALFGAFLVLVIAYIVGRTVAGLVTNLLTGIGFNAVLSRLGLGKEPEEGQKTPSQVVGDLALVAIMLFASIEALGLLNFESLSELLSNFTSFAGQVILGLVIFGLGLFLANLAAKTLEASASAQARLLAVSAKVAIMVLAGAMALRQMGVAPDIINLAFGLLLGAVALACGLAFGLGGREAAGQKVQDWFDSLKS